MTGMGLREAKQQQAKRAIFDAAMALFREKGFDQTSVEEIVARAGVSRATYFNYFRTKDGVLRFYGEQLAAQLTAIAAGFDPFSSALERLRTLIGAWADYTAAHREDARTVQLSSAGDPAYIGGMTLARRQMFEMILGIVKEGQAAGQLRRDLSAYHLTLHTATIFYGTLSVHVVTGEPLAPLFDSAWSVVLGGICHADTQTN